MGSRRWKELARLLWGRSSDPPLHPKACARGPSAVAPGPAPLPCVTAHLLHWLYLPECCQPPPTPHGLQELRCWSSPVFPKNLLQTLGAIHSSHCSRRTVLAQRLTPWALLCVSRVGFRGRSPHRVCLAGADKGSVFHLLCQSVSAQLSGLVPSRCVCHTVCWGTQRVGFHYDGAASGPGSLRRKTDELTSLSGSKMNVVARGGGPGWVDGKAAPGWTARLTHGSSHSACTVPSPGLLEGVSGAGRWPHGRWCFPWARRMFACCACPGRMPSPVWRL